jgi:hypothetical protein
LEKLMSDVESAKSTLTSLESKLQDAMSRRDKIAQETARVNAEAAAAHRYDPKLAPLNKQATVIDDEIALIRIQIRHARTALGLQEASAERVKVAQAVENGAPAHHLAQLEISTPDGRKVRQWHRSIDDARKALTAGYEVTGEVIGGTILSPIGRPFMKALLESEGDVLKEWLMEQGIVGSDKTVVILPSNNREKM